jgi:hypothetical protein
MPDTAFFHPGLFVFLRQVSRRCCFTTAMFIVGSLKGLGRFLWLW